MITWPRKIFFESTALFQLGSNLQKPEFAKLLERRDYLKFSILVSDVSWREYVRQRAEKIDELLSDVSAVKGRLSEWEQDTKEIHNTGLILKGHRDNLEKWYQDKANTAGIEILSLPGVDANRLLTMSIDRLPPFEPSKDNKSEKGFRDALIMFTVLENIRKRPEDFALVITKDTLLAKGLAACEAEFETKVSVVATLDEALEYIDARVEEWYRLRLRSASDEAKAMLGTYSREISDLVSAIPELTSSDLGVSGLNALAGSPLNFGETVEKVNSLTFERVESAIWKNQDTPVSQILFRLRCIANVTTTANVYLNPFTTPQSTTFRIGGEKQPPFDAVSIFASNKAEPEIERTLSIQLYGELRLQREGDSWTSAGLRIDKARPGPEELAAFRRIEKAL
jgi:hypothetical protein